MEKTWAEQVWELIDEAGVGADVILICGPAYKRSSLVELQEFGCQFF